MWSASRTTKKTTNAQLMVLYQKSYTQFMKIPGLRGQVKSIRKRLSSVNSYDEFTIRKETMRITFITLGIILIALLLLAFLSKSVMAVFFGLMLAIVLNGFLITIFVNRVEDKLLKQFTQFLEDERHYYQEKGLVDEAIYDAAQGSPHEVKLQTQRIHEILTSQDPKRALENYYTVAPNRYLKIFAGVSHLVMEYGDKVLSKGSMYLNSINKFVQEIRFDLLRRKQLSYRLNGLTLIALAPILLSFPIVQWAEKYFPITKEFYKARIGYIALISIFAASVLAYMMIRKLSELDEARYVAKSRRKQWEKKVYSWLWAKWIVDRFVPGKHTRKHYRLNMLLKESNSPLLMEWFYIHRILVSLASFIGVVVLSFFLHSNAVNQVLTSPTSERFQIIGQMSAIEAQKAKELTAFDNAIINDVKGVKENTREAIQAKVIEIADGRINDIALNNTVNRIMEKTTSIQNEYFRWWELVIALTAGIIGYYIPVWIQQFQRKMRSMEMQNEVDTFHALISILSEFDRVSVESILEWMERYSIIFRPALQRCLLNFDSGAKNALRELREEAPFESFDRIIRRLERAADKITVTEAFDDLEMEQEYYSKQKEERLARLIRKKASWGRIIGFVPGALLIVFWLVFPLLYTSVGQLTDVANQIMNFN